MNLDGKRAGNSLKGDIQNNTVGIIPSGNHTIQVVIEGDQGIGYRKDITYDFQAGGRYVVFGNVARSVGLLGSVGSDSIKIVSLDEFRPEWETMDARREGRPAERNDADYKKTVLDRFTNAENALNAKKIMQAFSSSRAPSLVYGY